MLINYIYRVNLFLNSYIYFADKSELFVLFLFENFYFATQFIMVSPSKQLANKRKSI